MYNNQNVSFADVRICFRNFSGKPNQYNREGARNFCMIFNDPAQAIAMQSDGWNVKQMKPHDDDENPPYYMPVKVNFEGRYPPKIVMITSRGQTILDETTVSMLDVAEIARVDLIVRPYTWEPGRITAYAKAMYVTIIEDEFERRYAAMEASAIDSMTGDLPF